MHDTRIINGSVPLPELDQTERFSEVCDKCFRGLVSCLQSLKPEAAALALPPPEVDSSNSGNIVFPFDAMCH